MAKESGVTSRIGIAAASAGCNFFLMSVPGASLESLPTRRRLLFPETWPPVVLAAVLLAIAVLVTYGATFSIPFVFEDIPTIARGAAVPGSWPLTGFSLVLNRAAGGWDVRGYHATNLLLHLVAGLLLFGVVYRTLQRPAIAEGAKLAPFASALAAAMLWLLHPLQTSAVIGIAGREELLGAIFCLGTIHAFIHGVEGPPSRGWVAVALLSCLCGMITGAAGAAIPILVLIYDRTFVAGTWREAWRLRRKFHLALAATSAGWIYFVARGVGPGGGVIVPGWDAVSALVRVIALSVKLAVWPAPLVLDYGRLAPASLAEIWLQATLVLLAGLAAVVALVRWPMRGFAAAWFFLTLLPGSLLDLFASEGGAEHRSYLALAAPCAVLVVGLRAWGGRRAMGGLLVVAVALGVVTYRRSQDYRSALSIWSDTVAKVPGNSRARLHYGHALLAAGRTKDAAAQYEAAIGLAPNEGNAHLALAGALLQSGRESDALIHYEHARRLGLDSADTHVGLAAALVRLGRMPEAIAHYEAAAKVGLLAADEQLRFGQALAEVGRFDDALQHLEAAVRLNPDDAGAHVILGMVLSAAGRAPEGLKHFFEAVRLRPDDAGANAALGDALLEDLRPAEALPHYEVALRLQPERAAVLHTAMGNALARLGRAAEAISHYEEALRLNPTDEEARTNLARIRAAAIRRGRLKN